MAPGPRAPADDDLIVAPGPPAPADDNLIVAPGPRAPAGASTAGTGVLEFTRVGSQTVVTRAFAASPLKLLTPRNHGHAAWVYTSSYGGGLVGGDTVSLDIHIGSGGAALVTTQASTKVYRSALGARQRITARVDTGGTLVLAPDPVVCFAGSSFEQEQDIALDPTATLALVDGLCSGRVAHGERWAFAEYRTRLVIRRGGQLLVCDGVRLSAGDDSLVARFGRFNVFLSAVLLGPLVREHAHDILTRAACLPVERRPVTLCTAAPIASDGALLRIAGVSFEAAWKALRDELSFLTRLLGDDPWTRKR